MAELAKLAAGHLRHHQRAILEPRLNPADRAQIAGRDHPGGTLGIGLHGGRLGPDQDDHRSAGDRARQERQAGAEQGGAAIAGDPAQPVGQTHELGDPRGPRPLIELGRRRHLLDLAGEDHRDPIGNRQRLVLVMGHEQGGDADLGLDPADLVAQIGPHLGIERRERLVQEQHLRLDRQRPRQRHPLLLSAGQLMRIAAALLAEMDQRQVPIGGLQPLRCRMAAQAQPEGDVLPRGHMREQAVGLEHHAHVAPVRRQIGDVAIIQQDPAGIQALQPGQGAQRRGLAAARRAQHRHQLARRQLEGQPIECSDIAELATKLAELHPHASAAGPLFGLVHCVRPASISHHHRPRRHGAGRSGRRRRGQTRGRPPAAARPARPPPRCRHRACPKG